MRLINQAEAYRNDIVPKARGEAEQIVLNAEASQRARVAEALGKAAEFEAILTEYRQAPLVTRYRLYLETVEKVLAETNDFLLTSEGGGEEVLPILNLGGATDNQTTTNAAAATTTTEPSQ